MEQAKVVLKKEPTNTEEDRSWICSIAQQKQRQLPEIRSGKYFHPKTKNRFEDA